MDTVRSSIAQSAQMHINVLKLIGPGGENYDDTRYMYVAEILPVDILPTSQIFGWLADLQEDVPRSVALSQLLPVVARLHGGKVVTNGMAKGTGKREAPMKREALTQCVARLRGQQQGTATTEPKGKGGGKVVAKGKGEAPRFKGTDGAESGERI